MAGGPVPAREYTSFDDYLENQSETCRSALRELRSIIMDAVPVAGETINYNIPAFQLVPGGKRDQQVMIAGFRRHVGLYPHPATIKHFEEHLSIYTSGKGSVQFPITEPLPRELIREMIRYTKALLDGGL